MNLRWLVLALLLGTLTSHANAQSIFDFDDWMQRIDDSSQDLQRHIDGRRREQAVDTARDIEQLYALMEKFFEKRGDASDAIRISREGKALAALIQSDLAKQKFKNAKANAIAIAQGCRGCHTHYKPL
jgi:hypothetical protein